MLLNSRERKESVTVMNPKYRTFGEELTFPVSVFFLLTSLWKTRSAANLCVSSEVWDRKKLHFYEYGLKFCPGKPCFKVCGCSDARPVKSLGYSELPPKNLFEMLTLLVNGRQYSSQFTFLAQTGSLNIKIVGVGKLPLIQTEQTVS